MSITSYIDLFLGALLNVMFYCVIIGKVFRVRIKSNKILSMILIILVAIGIGLINVFNKNTFKALMAIPLVAIGVNKIFDIKFSKSLYYTLISSFYLLIGDLLVSLILSILNINYMFLTQNILGKTIGNIFVIIATTPLIYINLFSNFFRKLTLKKLNSKTILIIFIVFLIIGSAFVFKSTANIENIISIVMNLVIFLVFVVLLYVSFIENKKLNKISQEYNTLFDYLEKYEKEIVEKRKLIHDFKNQLIVINGYAENNIKLKEYLNTIIEEQKSIKETNIIRNIDKLPKGLKGLMYYKLSQIENGLNIELNVKSKFKGFNNLSSKDNKNILKVIGILLDNAIESGLKSVDKYLSISLSENKEIFKLEIYNTHNDKIEKNKIMDHGISTKGINRGYGLSLVKDIINSNEKYNIKFDINESEFKVVFTVNTK